MKEGYLRAEHLAIGYDGKELIEDICLAVRRGEIMVLIGPNGAGKSTILKTLSRQLAPLAGAVYVDGDPAATMREAALAKKMALVMTERVDPERMTCREIVAMGRYPYTGRLGILGSEDKAVTERCLARVHARDIADAPFACVSDGQRQRIMLARAICQQPSVILLDEPTSFLDIRHKLELLDILEELVRTEKTAVVMSMHELDLAQKIADTVVCVQAGHPLRVGAPEDVLTDETVGALFGFASGACGALRGSPELRAPRGEPVVFVIGGEGSGVPVYRKLRRKGVPFAAGILWRGDQDYPVAKALAAVCVEEKSGEPVSEETFQKARAVLNACERAVCTLPAFGALTEADRRLWQAAGESGRQADYRAL